MNTCTFFVPTIIPPPIVSPSVPKPAVNEISPVGLSSKFKSISLNSSLELTEWFTGCCCLFKTKIFKDIGKLDERFFAYYEDIDWSIRIKNAGYDLAFIKSSVIYHHGSKSSQNELSEGKLSPLVHYLNITNHIFLSLFQYIYLNQINYLNN